MAKKLLIGLFLAIVIGCASLVGVVFFSNIPLNFLAATLEKSGVKIEGLSGTLNSGISFDKLNIVNEEGKISASTVVLSWSSMFKTFVERKIAIENVEAGQVLIEMNGLGKFKNTKTTSNSNAEESPDSKVARQSFLKTVFMGPGNPRGLLEFRIDQIHIKDFIVRETMTKKEFKMNEFTLQGMRVAYDEVTLKNLVIDSNYVSLLLKNATYKNGEFSMPDPIKGQARAEGLKELLLKDAPFTVQASFKGLKPENVDIKLFSEKMMVSGNEQGFALEIKDFSPAEFFVLPHPISSMSLRVKKSPIMAWMAGILEVDGQLTISKVSFLFDSSLKKGFEGSAIIAKKPYWLSLNSYALLQSFWSVKDVFKLKGPSSDVQENLAWVLSGKGKLQLNMDEQKTIAGWMPYFGLIPSADLLASTPQPGVPLKTKVTPTPVAALPVLGTKVRLSRSKVSKVPSRAPASVKAKLRKKSVPKTKKVKRK